MQQNSNLQVVFFFLKEEESFAFADSEDDLEESEISLFTKPADSVKLSQKQKQAAKHMDVKQCNKSIKSRNVKDQEDKIDSESSSDNSDTENSSNSDSGTSNDICVLYIFLYYISFIYFFFL